MFLRVRDISELETHRRVLLDAFIPEDNIKTLADVGSVESESHDGLIGH